MRRADLHIHSCLSPCGSLESSPRAIAKAAARKGLDMVALTDHNTARNCPAFAAACRSHGVTPLFGMEVTSIEEAHILALFGDLDAALDMDALVYGRLADVRNRPDLFGDQPVVDEAENVVEFLEKSLIGAVAIPIDELLHQIRRRGGLCIPAHVDRPMMSVYSQLGFLPDLPFDAVEATTPNPQISVEGHTLICSSDAHYPDDIGCRRIEIPGSTFEDLRRALHAGDVAARF